jgi:3D-(3,5/4)-trihydroxycyclohexane-1,2-dione acylhydrolase (decyclizing)
MPGDLHKLWRTRDPKGYHVEYGYSTMGYEIAGGLGVKLAAPDRDVYVMVGDGSFLMMAQEIVTAVQEGVELKIVLVQNRGFASIGALSESVGSQRFGTAYRTQEDLAKVAEGLGATVHRAKGLDELESALRGATGVTVVEIQTDPRVGAPDSEAWWDVPVAEVSGLDSTRAARETYEEHKQTQQQYLNPRERVTP